MRQHGMEPLRYSSPGIEDCVPVHAGSLRFSSPVTENSAPVHTEPLRYSSAGSESCVPVHAEPLRLSNPDEALVCGARNENRAAAAAAEGACLVFTSVNICRRCQPYPNRS